MRLRYGGIVLSKKTLNEQVSEIIRMAEESGVQQNFFFVTTLKRYQVQMSIMAELEKSMKSDGLLVTKEYVKGRKNMYASPAVAEYNRTADSANKTVSTLIRIIRNFKKKDGEDNPVNFDVDEGIDDDPPETDEQ